ncbi:SIR2 family protein [Mucilaginibacter ginsenosidivorans]|uniref:SIR2 family protein n=1 Tax=Mucilaginibacter ginsenosidivorans TaxID=398053 RepID=A0A5B8UU43_9SPHI|nr:SIR2 family protein [Mucilaginibacter ginsenosidivorans]QEC62419.1 SIR2 family protein [Mucilaginibacter ginsenosidivorans]
MAIPLSEFVKFFPLRANNLAWFFGAGSSVSAGVPSAYDLIWDFKRRIYCAEQSYPLLLFSNLTDPAIREQIQAFFDGQVECPPVDSVEEYSYYFERAFASPVDRSEYIGQQTSGMQLTYGHKVIGILMKHRFINIIFTTNFDKAFENTAAGQFSKLEDWYAADIESGENGMRFLQSGKRPIIVKLHGDYFSTKLKNTSEELQTQDQKLREILALTINTKGLCVMGYSGRDSSVMDVLHEALKISSSFPGGLFWFIRAGSKPLPEVEALINAAIACNKHAELVEIENFDTAWADIIKGFDTIASEDLGPLTVTHQLVNQPLPIPGKRYPLIRLNALEITQYPATARLYRCEAGNMKEVREVIKKQKSNLLAVRKKAGIIGFGSDDDFLSCFKHYGDFEMDLYQITSKDLMYDDSSTKELMVTALAKAIINNKPLRYLRKRERQLIIPDPKKINDANFIQLSKALESSITGYIPRTKLLWTVALEVNIHYLLNKPLLQLMPTIIVAKTSDVTEKKLVAPFVKEATARWFNTKFDTILNGWLKIIFGDEKVVKVSTFSSMTPGVNPTFEIAQTTAYSRSY